MFLSQWPTLWAIAGRRAKVGHSISRRSELCEIAFLLRLKRARFELKIAPAHHEEKDIPAAGRCQELRIQLIRARRVDDQQEGRRAGPARSALPFSPNIILQLESPKPSTSVSATCVKIRRERLLGRKRQPQVPDDPVDDGKVRQDATMIVYPRSDLNDAVLTAMSTPFRSSSVSNVSFATSALRHFVRWKIPAM